MALFAMEHSKAAYRADFALYAAVIVGAALFLPWAGPRQAWAAMAVAAAAGLAAWSILEYLLHRFILHGLPPFRGWHALHHARPKALICAPTTLSASLVATLVFLPALLVSDPWIASSLTLGVLVGYLAYAVTHHGTHHWRGGNAWFASRRRWHALHHHRGENPGCYGVTSAFWDHVFGSAAVVRAPAHRVRDERAPESRLPTTRNSE